MKTLKDLVIQQKFRFNDFVEEKSNYFVENNLVENLHYNGEDTVEAIVTDKLRRNVSFYVLRDFIITGCSCPSSQPCEHAMAVIKYFKNHIDDEITCFVPELGDLFTRLNNGYDSKNFTLDTSTKPSFINTTSYVNDLLTEFWNKKFINFYIKLFYNYFIVLIKINVSKNLTNDYNKQFNNFIKNNLLRISHCYDEFFEYYKNCLKKNQYLYSVVNSKILSDLLESDYSINLNTNNILGYIAYIDKNLKNEFSNSNHYSGYTIARDSLQKLMYYYNKKMVESNNVDILEKIKSNLDDNINRQVYLEHLLEKNDFTKIKEIYAKYGDGFNTLLTQFCYLKCLEYFKEYNELMIKILYVFRNLKFSINEAELIIKNFKKYFSLDDWLDIGGAIFGNKDSSNVLTILCSNYDVFNFYNDAIENFKEIDDKFTIYKNIHNKELCYIYHSKIIELIPFESNYIDHYNISRIRNYVDKLLLLTNGYYFAVDAVDEASKVCYSYALNDIKRYLDYRKEK